MKKKLIIINGTMGVGKSVTSEALYKSLENSAWLDGDWCWMMNPFIVNEENKKMVIDNIVHLLRSFLTNASLEYVVFNWVIHEEEIYDLILSSMDDLEVELYKITLLCSEEILKQRILEDFKNGRGDRNLENSLKRLEMYRDMNTIKVDTSYKEIKEVVTEIVDMVQ